MSSRRSQGEQFGLCSARLSVRSGKPSAEALDLSRVMAGSDSIPRRSRRREAFGVYPDHSAQPSGADTARMLRKMGSLGTAATDLALTWRSPVCDGHCGEPIAFRRDDSRSPERSHRKRFGLRAVARKIDEWRLQATNSKFDSCIRTVGAGSSVGSLCINGASSS